MHHFIVAASSSASRDISFMRLYGRPEAMGGLIKNSIHTDMLDVASKKQTKTVVDLILIRVGNTDIAVRNEAWIHQSAFVFLIRTTYESY
jgi:hypothetical protein